MADKVDISRIGRRPVNPFISPEGSDALSPVQRKIADFVRQDTAKQQRRGVQPPDVQIFEEESEAARAEAEAEREFLLKYKITPKEHEQLTSLVFYGKVQLPFHALGHTFLFRDLPADKRRYLADIGSRVTTGRAKAHIAVLSVAESLVEIDGIHLSSEFLRHYLWNMQAKVLDVLYRMHIATERYKLYLYKKLPNFCRTPTSQIRYAIAESTGKLINDPVMQAMSEEQVYWHYINAMKGKEIDNDVTANWISYLTWFINPEMAKKTQEHKEMHKDADANMVQKYSFMSEISKMIGRDMDDGQVGDTMDILMKKLKDRNSEDVKDPWAPPEDEESSDPFSDEIERRARQDTETPAFGMFGGSDDWYKKN